MSFKENVERKKSTRWVKASTANYDGDNWSDDDDEYDNDENYDNESSTPSISIPKLPAIPQQYQNQPVPSTKTDYDEDLSYDEQTPKDLNLEKFQQIDLDDHIQDSPNIASPEQLHDEYTDLIIEQNGDDDDDDADDYKPQSSQRFQLPEVDDETVKSPILEQDPVIDEPFVEEVHQSQFNGLPTEDDEIESHHSQQVDYAPQYEENYSHSNYGQVEPLEPLEPLETQAAIPEQDLHEGFSNVTPHDSSLHDSHTTDLDDHYSYEENDNLSADKDQIPVVDELAIHDHDKTLHDVNNTNNNDDNNTNDDYNIINDHGKNDNANTYNYTNYNNDDEYLNAVPLSDDEEDFDNRAEEKHVEPIDEYVSQPTHFQSNFVAESSNQLNAQDDDTQNDDYNDFLKSQQESPKSEHLQIEQSPIVEDVSDTDTLHIIDDSSIDDHNENTSNNDHLTIEVKSNESQQVENENPKPIVRDFSQPDFKEHAYLSSIINTPDLNKSHETFASQEQEVEERHYKSSLDPSTRESQYYNSVNDYFDDYAEDDQRLSKIPSASSGSLSTGGASIKSEGYRNSRFSDRTASFTIQSLNASDAHSSGIDQSQSQSSQFETASNHSSSLPKESNLNPALSINLGQWRPNTDSFRDQFINGGAPPIPKIDNYTRNSRGEIVEEIDSVVDESDVGSLAHSSFSKDVTDLNGSSSNVPGTAPTVGLPGTYKTESNSVLPLHIPLGLSSTETGKTYDTQTDVQQKYFQEHLNTTETTLKSDENKSITNGAKLPKRTITSYNLKQIGTLDKSTTRIEKYRSARIEEANVETGLSIWLSETSKKIEVLSYSSNVSSAHVRKAYAEASTNVKKHNNMGSFLNKRRVFHDAPFLETSSKTAHNFAKGIFSKGKKIIKNDK